MALVFASVGNAFAAANTIVPGGAGYKDSVVSGYAITNVIYDLNTNPTKIDKIIFDIAPINPNIAEPVTVMISTKASQDFTTSTCVITKPLATSIATCTFTTAVNVVDVVQLDIVATSSTNP